MDRPKGTKRVIRCEACGRIKRLMGSSGVWVEAVTTNFLTGVKVGGGYLARICRDCRPKVGYKIRGHGENKKA